MGFLPGQKPPKKGETIAPVTENEQSQDEIDNVIDNMKKESETPNVKQEETDKEIQEVKEEIQNNSNKEDYIVIDSEETIIDDLMKKPLKELTEDEHVILMEHLGHEKYLELFSWQKKQQDSMIEDVSTTYKGVKATKRVITQLIIGNTVVRQEVKDIPTIANITLD